MNRLAVMFKYTSRCENVYCVAIVAHRWLLVSRDSFEIKTSKFVYAFLLKVQYEFRLEKCSTPHCVALVVPWD